MYEPGTLYLSERHLLLHTAEGERVVVDPLDVYLLEADGDSTRVRRASATELVDIRELGQVAPTFERHGFVQVHREFVVNPQSSSGECPSPGGCWAGGEGDGTPLDGKGHRRRRRRVIHDASP